MSIGGSVATVVSCALLLCGCVLSDVDLGEKRCPCGPGYTCDESRDRCVRGEPDGAAPMDASDDAGESDGGEMDSGTEAGTPDGGPTDGGPTDGGPTDGGADGGLDAGLTDAGTDAGVDAGPDPSACDDTLSGAAFCDGFEDVGLTAWDGSYGSGTTEQSTSTVYRGTGALAAETEPGDFAGIETADVSGLTTDVWVRGYVYIPSGFDLVDVGMMYVGAGSVGIGMGVENGGDPYVYIGAASEGVSGSTVGVPRDTWTCMRAHVAVSDTDGVAEVWVNEDLAARRTGLDTQAADPYSSFAAGLTYASPSGDPPNVLVDEVAVGPDPLPCD